MEQGNIFEHETGAGMNVHLRLEEDKALEIGAGIYRNLNLEQGNRFKHKTGAGMDVYLRLEQDWILDKYLNLDRHRDIYE